MEEGGHTYRNCGGNKLEKFNNEVKAIYTTIHMLTFVSFRLFTSLFGGFFVLYIKYCYECIGSVLVIVSVLIEFFSIPSSVAETVLYLLRSREIVKAKKEMIEDLRKIFS